MFLTFYCGQRYVPGHKCSGKMYLLEVIADEDDESMLMQVEGSITMTEEVREELNVVESVQFQESQLLASTPQIPLNALSGVNSYYKTIRVKGYVVKHVLHFLMNTGSTHNFLSWSTAKTLGGKLGSTVPLKVSVANGNQMISIYMCKGFQWTLQGITYSADVMILRLGSCDVVLGVQWLSTLDDIFWNFRKLTLEFQYNKKRTVLRSSQQAALPWIGAKEKVFKGQSASDMAMCVYPAQLWNVTGSELDSEVPLAEIRVVLDDFAPVFEVPKGLVQKEPMII